MWQLFYSTPVWQFKQRNYSESSSWSDINSWPLSFLSSDSLNQCRFERWFFAIEKRKQVSFWNWGFFFFIFFLKPKSYKSSNSLSNSTISEEGFRLSFLNQVLVEKYFKLKWNYCRGLNNPSKPLKNLISEQTLCCIYVCTVLGRKKDLLKNPHKSTSLPPIPNIFFLETFYISTRLRKKF